ncbi:MAG: quinone-dependent dihydroorotate dehydrogenase [Bacteriovoracaceae bacterium]
MNFYSLFKHIAFQSDPEFVHDQTINLMSKFPIGAKLFQHPYPCDKKYECNVGQLKWSFPIGLAAGLDKNGKCLPFFAQLLFGAIEVGTVTPKPQSGNEKPRLFRYVNEASLRNSMGFNNDGAEKLLKNIELYKMSNYFQKPIGVNLGKNQVTPLEDTHKDYQFLYHYFAHIADYLVINISSPNTTNLRSFQNIDLLEKLLASLDSVREKAPKPLFLKVAPDLEESEIESIVSVVSKYKLAGIIATNTTKIEAMGAGGVSGKLLKQKATLVRKTILHYLKKHPNLAFIGTGGVDSFDELLDFWKLGGDAMQIYTSFIYQGPELLMQFKYEIDKTLNKYNVKNVNELIQKLHS